MAQDATRLRRLITEELGECCAGDIEERLATIEAYADAVPDDAAADRSALRVLGDDTRHRIARLLAAADGELCVCEVTPVLDVTDSAVSHALSDLTDAGLVTRRKEGTWRYYDTTGRAEALLDALDATRGRA